ncbi:hypothetical protein BCR34DRAFT_575156 [Clohesyomyces aquaticus]|uniref:P-loop containing nucleoside triphosphate hydrolase protein n=1 Tax=Clohesyomyces aquaticus TaxID=1231657 RepID=A0A1Y1YT37_9PLEO|nr:hypothetical protein BCR34DRAFT_575156 [Clohesyomyces aquaticus]
MAGEIIYPCKCIHPATYCCVAAPGLMCVEDIYVAPELKRPLRPYLPPDLRSVTNDLSLQQIFFQAGPLAGVQFQMTVHTRLIDAVPPASRQKPMGVLALGMSRTGINWATKSIIAQSARPDGRRTMSFFFKEAMEAKLHGKGKLWTGAELDKAIEDIPCLHFVDELLEQYPKAKVILTTRDIDSWERSVQNTIFKIVNLRIVRFIVAIDPTFWQPYY